MHGWVGHLWIMDQMWAIELSHLTCIITPGLSFVVIQLKEALQLKPTVGFVKEKLYCRSAMQSERHR